jgi:hypothetical protein
MTRKQIAAYRTKLVQIQKEIDTDKKWEKTRDLALEIGASIWRIHPFKDSDVTETTIDGTKINIKETKEATTAEMVHNIHYALQTATMIEMCRISNRNFWIALIATVISPLAMLAAWMAVFLK